MSPCGSVLLLMETQVTDCTLNVLKNLFFRFTIVQKKYFLSPVSDCRYFILSLSYRSPWGDEWQVQVSVTKVLTYHLIFQVLIQQEDLLQDELHLEAAQDHEDQGQALLPFGRGAWYGMNDVPLGGNLFDHGPGTLSKYSGFSSGYIRFTSTQSQDESSQCQSTSRSLWSLYDCSLISGIC